MLVVHSRHQPTRTGITTAQLTVLSRTIGWSTSSKAQMTSHRNIQPVTTFSGTYLFMSFQMISSVFLSSLAPENHVYGIGDYVGDILLVSGNGSGAITDKTMFKGTKTWQKIGNIFVQKYVSGMEIESSCNKPIWLLGRGQSWFWQSLWSCDGIFHHNSGNDANKVIKYTHCKKSYFSFVKSITKY